MTRGSALDTPVIIMAEVTTVILTALSITIMTATMAMVLATLVTEADGTTTITILATGSSCSIIMADVLTCSAIISTIGASAVMNGIAAAVMKADETDIPAAMDIPVVAGRTIITAAAADMDAGTAAHAVMAGKAKIAVKAADMAMAVKFVLTVKDAGRAVVAMAEVVMKPVAALARSCGR